ncbi:MAG TPA: 5-(carboxyamino)imidazole ribonucleotide mutase, partial [Hydrogenobaculum sp.]|nr:5-(carboxyamino)imidazole ribonucleotide mutase [Hydrogenobaculum sp.]
IVQMPKGIPVATVAIGNAHNAALLAIRILSIKYDYLFEKLKNHQNALKDKVYNMVI